MNARSGRMQAGIAHVACVAVLVLGLGRAGAGQDLPVAARDMPVCEDGKEPYRSWKDAVNVRRQETVRFIVRFDDFPGKWMFHCHILNHEDQGMMGILEVKR